MASFARSLEIIRRQYMCQRMIRMNVHRESTEGVAELRKGPNNKAKITTFPSHLLIKRGL
eukprot:scaffold367416_cov34-Prasinocladus_malaysianus.AAC.1